MDISKVAMLIERIEVRILGWTRTLVTVVIVGALVVGLFGFVGALLDVSASPEVTLDSGDIEVMEFDDSFRNVQPEPREDDRQNEDRTARPTPANQGEREKHVFQEEINEMVSLLRPLYDAFEFNTGRTEIEAHLEHQIERIQKATEEVSDSSSVQEDRLEDAVSGMVEYVEDMVDHYTDEIDLDEETSKAQTAIADSFRNHVDGVLRAPVDPFVTKYEAACKDLGMEADNAKIIAAQRNLEGASGFVALGIIGLIMLGGVLLLLVFKVEQSLRQYAGQATHTGGGIDPTQADQKRDAGANESTP